MSVSASTLLTKSNLIQHCFHASDLSCYVVVVCCARLLAHFSIIAFEIHVMEMNRGTWTSFACVLSVVSVYLPIMGTFLHCVLKIFSSRAMNGRSWTGFTCVLLAQLPPPLMNAVTQTLFPCVHEYARSSSYL